MIKKSLWAYFYDALTKGYAKFSGRSRRREFWGFMLWHTILSGLLWVLGVLLFTPINDLFNPRLGSALIWLSVIFPGAVLMAIYSLATIPASLAVTVRRFHDVGLSGKWLLVMYIVQQVAAYLPLFFLFWESAPEEIAWLFQGLSHAFSLLCSIFLIVITCKDSQAETNKWGENPKFSSEV